MSPVQHRPLGGVALKSLNSGPPRGSSDCEPSEWARYLSQHFCKYSRWAVPRT